MNTLNLCSKEAKTFKNLIGQHRETWTHTWFLKRRDQLIQTTELGVTMVLAKTVDKLEKTQNQRLLLDPLQVRLLLGDQHSVHHAV